MEALPNVLLLPRTIAFGYYPHNWIGLAEKLTDHLPQLPAGKPRERLWQVRAKQVVIAAGAIERPLVFADNDRPGIMLADAARTYLQEYGVAVGRKVVIVTAHDNGYRTAHELKGAGVEIVAIADIRHQSPAADGARAAGLRVLLGASIDGTKGRLRVSNITVVADGKRETLACDAVLMAGGFTPSVHLFPSRAASSSGIKRCKPICRASPQKQSVRQAHAAVASVWRKPLPTVPARGGQQRRPPAFPQRKAPAPGQRTPCHG